VKWNPVTGIFPKTLGGFVVAAVLVLIAINWFDRRHDT
jgi:hypothetical protein